MSNNSGGDGQMMEYEDEETGMTFFVPRSESRSNHPEKVEELESPDETMKEDNQPKVMKDSSDLIKRPMDQEVLHEMEMIFEASDQMTESEDGPSSQEPTPKKQKKQESQDCDYNPSLSSCDESDDSEGVDNEPTINFSGATTNVNEETDVNEPDEGSMLSFEETSDFHLSHDEVISSRNGDPEKEDDNDEEMATQSASVSTGMEENNEEINSDNNSRESIILSSLKDTIIENQLEQLIQSVEADSLSKSTGDSNDSNDVSFASKSIEIKEDTIEVKSKNARKCISYQRHVWDKVSCPEEIAPQMARFLVEYGKKARQTEDQDGIKKDIFNQEEMNHLREVHLMKMMSLKVSITRDEFYEYRTYDRGTYEYNDDPNYAIREFWTRIQMTQPPQETYLSRLRHMIRYGSGKENPILRVTEGQACFFCPSDDPLFWVPGIIDKIINPDGHDPLYSLSFTNTKSNLKKCSNYRSKSQVAILPPLDMPLKLGFSVYCHGRIGFLGMNVPPSDDGSNHLLRYLVLFDDGTANYCPKRDIHVCIDPNYREELKYHLSSLFRYYLYEYRKVYPNVMMVNRTPSANMITIQHQSKSMLAKIEFTTFDTMTLRYKPENSTEMNESIHRGSIRIESIRDVMIPRFHQQLVKHPKLREVQYPSCILAQEIDLCDESSPKKDKEFMYKLTYDSEEEDDLPDFLAQKVRVRDPPQICDKSKTFVKDEPDISFAPKQWVQHVCSPKCVLNPVASEFRGRIPYSMPILFGFARETVSIARKKDAIYYKGPCGKRLNSIHDVREYLFDTDSKFGVDYFVFDSEVRVHNPQSYKKLHFGVCVDDITNGEETQPISLVNYYNMKVLDSSFEYMPDRRFHESVQPNFNTEFLPQCSCMDNCAEGSCECRILNKASFKEVNGGIATDYSFKRLWGSVENAIYECNPNCPCASTCANRVVQNGIKVLLQVYMTPKKGWGVRALHDIPAGAFISTYSAMVYSQEVADKEGRMFGDEYLANIDFMEIFEQKKASYEAAPLVELEEEDDFDFEDVESPEPSNGPEVLAIASGTDMASTPYVRRSLRKKKAVNRNGADDVRQVNETRRKEVLTHKTQVIVAKSMEVKHKYYRMPIGPCVLDAKHRGNIGRFFNHSCDPNVYPQNVFTNTHDMRFPVVAYFALRNIKAFEEITWDYGYEIGSVAGREIPCDCRSGEWCRGRLL